MEEAKKGPTDRRSLLKLIGTVAGSTIMYQAMDSLGFAAQSDFTGPVSLPGDPKGASVLVLGAGWGGMVAAYELGKAGYKVQLLEYNDRVGGRNWTLYGGDTYTELGGFTQHVQFDQGHYLNPGPWRIPYHHRGIIHYANMLNVPLEPFCQTNYAAYVHSDEAFGGTPKRYREVQADFNGYTAELLAKATSQNKLDHPVTQQDKETLLQAMKEWGALDKNYEYKKGLITSARRGFDKEPGGGLDAEPAASEPMVMRELLKSGLWRSIMDGHNYDHHNMMFQPVGGMGQIGKAFGRKLENVVQYNSKVTKIQQDDKGVTVTYVDAKKGGAPRQVHADWCVCNIPASVLSQIPINVGAPMKRAIDSLHYTPNIKVGLQFKRRFWEQDEAIYGGITYTDQVIRLIGYPNYNFGSDGPGVVIGAYTGGQNGYYISALSPEDRIKVALDCGARIHPQYKKEFQTGVAVAFSRIPWMLGSFVTWTDEMRAEHYNNLCQIDGRIVMVGEHVSYLTGWQEGAILGSLDAIKRLHKRVLSA